VLGAIPGLDALVEGHLRGGAGSAVVASIKDSNQQDALIARWQGSSVFRAFFGHNGPPPGLQAAGGAAGTTIAPAVPSREVEVEEEEEDMRDETPPLRLPPARRVSQQPPASQRSRRSVSSFAAVMPEQPKLPAAATTLGSPFQPRDSLSDIVAKDAAQSYACISCCLYVAGNRLTDM
jgi:hypothetical protein